MNNHHPNPAKDPHIYKNIRSFLEELQKGDSTPMEEMEPEQARKVLEGAQKKEDVGSARVEVQQQTISQDGKEVLIYIARPAGVSDTLPAFIFIHGGGWVLGDYPTHARLFHDLVEETQMVGVFVEYTRSPEARFPKAIHEIYAVSKWLHQHGNTIQIDAARLGVIGNSVGGNMATVLTLMCKEQGGPKLGAQVLLWPVTDAHFETASYNDFAEGRFLTKGMMKWFWDLYLPETSKRAEIFASPLRATPKQLSNLPPALIQTAENDVLRDEGEAYARLLDEANVPTTQTRYQGMIHDFGLLNALADEPSVRSSIQEAAQFLKKHL
jgi:acetyl esterase/lipase